MKQNGFTLIELIGVVAIIAVVMLVTAPQIMSTMTNSQTKSSEALYKDIELAAQSYVENNWNTFKAEYEGKKKNSNMYCLSIKTLVANDYIKSSNLIDSSTNEAIDPNTNYVLLTNESSSTGKYRFTFKYVGKTC